MADLSKPQPHQLCRPFYLACMLACATAIGLVYGHYQHKQGFKEGVRRGACYWELMGSNADAYPKQGYYTCRIQTAHGLPVNVELTFDRSAEE